MQLFLVILSASSNAKVIVWASGREEAKTKAHLWLGYNKDQYIVEPITNKGDRVKVDITLNV